MSHHVKLTLFYYGRAAHDTGKQSRRAFCVPEAFVLWVKTNVHWKYPICSEVCEIAVPANEVRVFWLIPTTPF